MWKIFEKNGWCAYFQGMFRRIRARRVGFTDGVLDCDGRAMEIGFKLFRMFLFDMEETREEISNVLWSLLFLFSGFTRTAQGQKMALLRRIILVVTILYRKQCTRFKAPSSTKQE